MYRIILTFITAAVTAAATVAAQPCEWSALRDGAEEPVFAVTTFDDGRGDALYIGGSFSTVDRTIIARGVARWDGRSWEALGDGLRSGSVFSLAVFDDGSGPALYAGGTFETSGGKPVRGIAKWDGAFWTEVGGGIAGGATKPAVYALTVFDDGSRSALYAGGSFGSVGGEPGTNFIASWDGERWRSVGGGMGSYVFGLGLFDDGSGPALYAGGYFKTAGGTSASHIAQWDGASWSEVGGGMDKGVGSFAVFDDGRGQALYAGGPFSEAGGTPASSIARWDGHMWSEVGGGTERSASLAVFDDGSGPALYAGGAFTRIGDTVVNGIARWDGRTWESLGAGVGGTLPSVGPMVGFDDGSSPALYIGGSFATAGGAPAGNIARWRCQTCPADCDGSGDLTFFDFLCFQNLFAAADPQADCDGSGRHDFFDFLCFQNAFAAGCP